MGIYEIGQDMFFGFVYANRDEFFGVENYGMKWYRLDEARNCERVCTVAEKNGLYTYWKDKNPVLSTDGNITIFDGNGEATTVNATVFLSGTVPYKAEYGVSGEELVRKIEQESKGQGDYYIDEYECSEVSDYVTIGDTVYFVIKEYSTHHQAGLRSMLIGAMDASGNVLQYVVG